jgi:hypothetical protein
VLTTRRPSPPPSREALQPYAELCYAVRNGDLVAFKAVAEQHAGGFRADKVHNLLTRLHHNVIRTGAHVSVCVLGEGGRRGLGTQQLASCAWRSAAAAPGCMLPSRLSSPSARPRPALAGAAESGATAPAPAATPRAPCRWPASRPAPRAPPFAHRAPHQRTAIQSMRGCRAGGPAAGGRRARPGSCSPGLHRPPAPRHPPRLPPCPSRRPAPHQPGVQPHQPGRGGREAAPRQRRRRRVHRGQGHQVRASLHPAQCTLRPAPCALHPTSTQPVQSSQAPAPGHCSPRSHPDPGPVSRLPASCVPGQGSQRPRAHPPQAAGWLAGLQPLAAGPEASQPGAVACAGTAASPPPSTTQGAASRARRRPTCTAPWSRSRWAALAAGAARR